MRAFRTAATLLLLILGAAVTLAQEDNFDPDNPPEPNVTYRLALVTTPEGVASTYGEGDYAKGEEVTVGTYANSDHYLFRYWTCDGEVVSEEPEFTLTIKGDITLTAVYEQDPDNPTPPANCYYLTLLTDDDAGGRVEGPTEPVMAGTGVEIWAYPNEGYSFVGWYDSNGELLSEEATMGFFMPEHDMTLTARFQPFFDPDSPDEPYAQFTLTLATSPEGVAETSGGGTYYSGDEVSVSTECYSDHYIFRYWMCDDEVVSEEQAFAYVMENACVTLVAVYEENPDNPLPPEGYHYLHVQSNWEEAGWVEGPNDMVEEGTVVEVSAHANEGYIFMGWCDENGELLSGEATMAYVMPDHDVTLSACFEQLFNPDNPEEPYADQDDVDNDFDVNEDGDTDVADVMAIVLHILGSTPSVFREDKADVNGDGDITIADAVRLVGHLTGDTDFANAIAMRLPGSLHPQPLSTEEGGFCMQLTQSNAYTAVQMDVTVEGDGLLQGVSLTGDDVRHQLLYRKVGEGRWRVVVFSLSNNSIGSDVRLHLTTSAPAIIVSGIHYATHDGNDHLSDDLSATTAIGVTATTADDATYYDLQGRRTLTPRHGIYIRNGKKVTIH